MVAMIRRQDRSAASWVFGLLLLAFLVWVFVFAPETLPEYKQRMLGVFLAALAGLFAFFLTGDIGLDIQSKQSRFGKLALKAIAEGRSDDARRLLGKAQKTKEVELVQIYQALAETEIYDGRYVDAVSWYEKALSLNPDDPRLLNGIGGAFIYAGNYVKAESPLRQALAIWENGLGPEHPDVAPGVNTLAALYQPPAREAEAGHLDNGSP